LRVGRGGGGGICQLDRVRRCSKTPNPPPSRPSKFLNNPSTVPTGATLTDESSLGRVLILILRPSHSFAGMREKGMFGIRVAILPYSGQNSNRMNNNLENKFSFRLRNQTTSSVSLCTKTTLGTRGTYLEVVCSPFSTVGTWVMGLLPLPFFPAVHLFHSLH
jgi:hypothetical protein